MKIHAVNERLVVETIGQGVGLIRPFINVFVGEPRVMLPVWIQRFEVNSTLDDILKAAAGDSAPLPHQRLDVFMNLPSLEPVNGWETKQASIVGAAWRLHYERFPISEGSGEEAELFILKWEGSKFAGLLTPTKKSCEDVIALSKTLHS